MENTFKAAVFNIDGTGDILDFSEENLSELIRETVGGHFDAVSLPKLGLTMWVHDEGKLLGFEPNRYGTLMWSTEYGQSDVIVGNVLLTGGADAEGNTLGLPQSFIDEVLIPSKHAPEDCPCGDTHEQ